MPRRILRWASNYVGYRGVVAFLLGLIWFMLGLSMLIDPAGSRLPDTAIPLWLRATLFWMAPGLYAIAWQVATPPENRDDHNVWAVLMFGPAVRCATFLAAGIIDAIRAVFHTGWTDYRGTVIGTLVWLAIVALVYSCASGLDRLPPARRPGWRRHG